MHPPDRDETTETDSVASFKKRVPPSQMHARARRLSAVENARAARARHKATSAGSRYVPLPRSSSSALLHRRRSARERERRKPQSASGTRVPPLANPFHFRKNWRFSFAHSQATTFSFSPQRSSSSKNNDAGRHKVAHCCPLEQRRGKPKERGRVQELGARVKEGKERKFRTNGVRTRREKRQQSRSQHEQKQERERETKDRHETDFHGPAGRYVVRAVVPPILTRSFFFFFSEPRLTLAGLQRCFSPRSLGMHGKSPRPAQGWFRSRGPLQHGPRTFAGAGGIGLRLHSGQASSIVLVVASRTCTPRTDSTQKKIRK